MSVWNELSIELELWHAAGKTPELWWRDDDAVVDTESLRRLSKLSKTARIPLFLAVIPEGADVSLGDVFSDNANIYALQHGYSHTNHAPVDQRKMELGDHRQHDIIRKELVSGQRRLQELLADRFYPVLVPPWNRISTGLVEVLSDDGFTGISSLNPRNNRLNSGIIEVNVHVDLIDWKQRCFAGDESVLRQLVSHLQAKRDSTADATEPTGIMTHHLAHDNHCWDFLQRLFEFLDGSGVRWLNPDQLFTSQG